MKNNKKSTLIYVVAGIIVGYLSFLMKEYFETDLIQPFFAVFAMLVVAELMRTVFKIDQKIKWFWSNGGWIYLFVWFIVWIIFYNL